MKNITQHILSVTVSLMLFAGVPLLYAWTGPTATPPAGNVASPVNVGAVSQNKSGVLGLGGLAVFGKSLFSATGGYTLPSSKPDMLVGVNGAIGAAQYCDQYGNNCVSTLAGGVTSAPVTNVSTGGVQYLPGWPAKIACNRNGTRWGLVDFSGVEGNTVYYSDKQDRGYITGFNINTKKNVSNQYGDLAPYAAPCVGKDLTDPIWTWY